MKPKNLMFDSAEFGLDEFKFNNERKSFIQSFKFKQMLNFLRIEKCLMSNSLEDLKIPVKDCKSESELLSNYIKRVTENGIVNS